MEKRDFFRELLGIKVLEIREGYAKMTMPVAEEHLNFMGSTHGGAVFALADCAFGAAVNFGGNRAVAVQVSINYLKPSAKGDTLTAEASVVSEGKTFALCNVNVSKEGKAVALFTGLAYKMPPDKKT
jgi:acyl-CoA thioesterase